MTAVLVNYQGAPAALVGTGRHSFLGDVGDLPLGHPVVRTVAYMAFYAQLVLAGEMPEPYTDRDAECFARYAMIDAIELDRIAGESDERLAARFRVPQEQVELARNELTEPGSKP
jgi:hypothetical protein